MTTAVSAPGLLFVFDEEGGLIDRLVFLVRKKLGTLRNECRLSQLTRTGMREQPEWRAFTQSLGVPVRYLHREEFRSHHQAMKDVELPAVFLCYEDGSLELTLRADQIRSCATRMDLEQCVRRCVAGIHRGQAS